MVGTKTLRRLLGFYSDHDRQAGRTDGSQSGRLKTRKRWIVQVSMWQPGGAAGDEDQSFEQSELLLQTPQLVKGRHWWNRSAPL